MQETETNQTESQNVEESVALEQDIIAAEQTEQPQPVADEQPNLEQAESAAVPTNQTPVIADKPKKKRKKWIVVITAIVLAAAIGVGGWFAFPSIKGFVNDIIDEYKFPRMKFASEQEMINYLKGSWQLKKIYNKETNKLEDFEPDFSMFRYFYDDGCQYYFTFAIPQMPRQGQDKSAGREFFEKYPTFDDYLKKYGSYFTYEDSNYKKGKVDDGLYILKNGELKLGFDSGSYYIFEKWGDEKAAMPYLQYLAISREYTGVSEDIITQAMRGKSYETGIWSMKLGSLLDELCPDYQVKIEPYEEVKDKLSTYEEKLNSDYADCLDRTYLVTVTGRVLYNIDVPNYYSGEQDLISVLLVFDENSELIASAIPDESRDFEVSALLCMQRGY